MIETKGISDVASRLHQPESAGEAPHLSTPDSQEALRRVEHFLATLGHELRNPLGALKFALQVWELNEQNSAEMDHLRQVFDRQICQLSRLCDDLIDIARLTQGRIELRREDIDLFQLMNEAREEIQPFIDRCGHVIVLNPPPLPIWLNGDRSRLLQVFANLIQNAAKFTSHHGRLSVMAAVDDGWAVARVRDNGPGIDGHSLSAIFDGGSAANRAWAPSNDGLGIGLKLAQTIVQLHGGTIDAYSDGPGQGSEFTVRLPLTRTTSQDPPVVNRLCPSRSIRDLRRLPRHSIVVVDDDRTQRTLLARLLRTIGQSVLTAKDGETAARLISECRPQVVLIDLFMPGVDGYELARQLRKASELNGVVLIALSGNTEEISRLQAKEAGFDVYLVKPAGVEDIAQVLAQLPPSETPFPGDPALTTSSSHPGIPPAGREMAGRGPST